MFLNHVHGFAEAFIIRGETPMLMGRPIIEELGMVLNFKNRTLMFDGHPWRPITVGRHGEYLLSLTEDFDHELIGHPPSFDLSLKEESPEADTSVLSLNPDPRLDLNFRSWKNMFFRSPRSIF